MAEKYLILNYDRICFRFGKQLDAKHMHYIIEDGGKILYSFNQLYQFDIDGGNIQVKETRDSKQLFHQLANYKVTSVSNGYIYLKNILCSECGHEVGTTIRHKPLIERFILT